MKLPPIKNPISVGAWWKMMVMTVGFALTAHAQLTVPLPVEVMGPAGTSQTVSVTVGSGTPVSLWMQIHGENYGDKISVQINSGPITPLDNATSGLTIADPERSYGGIGAAGGGIGCNYPTVQMTLTIPAGSNVVAGTNTITFTFNGTDGVSSGFRVLAFNILDASGNDLITSTFTPFSPTGSQFTAPSGYNDPTDIAAGKAAFQAESTLISKPGGTSIIAACADCHTLDGHDLKAFNYSNYSIEARCLFHGLSTTQGLQVASYIRNNAYTASTNAAPWNPPYQPAPGLDTRNGGAITEWAAGGGMYNVLPHDIDTLATVFPNGISANVNPTMGTDLNMRQMPIDLPLLDWNHWLPRIHPLDAATADGFGTNFLNSSVNKFYNGQGGGSAAHIIYTWLQTGLAANLASGAVQNVFTEWANDSEGFITPITSVTGYNPTGTQAEEAYSYMQWKEVKMWDVMTLYGLEGDTQYFYGYATSTPKDQELRGWPDGEAFQSSPARQHIPEASALGSFVNSDADYEYLNNAWYHIELALNPGNRKRAGNDPIDWGYIAPRVKDLQQASENTGLPNGWPEATRLSSMVIKAMQQDAGINETGPMAYLTTGWNGQHDADLTNLINPGYVHEWDDYTNNLLPNGANLKRQILNALVYTWYRESTLLSPNNYTIADWNNSGLAPVNEVYVNNLDGGDTLSKVYGELPYLRSAGVDPTLLNSIAYWGSQVWTNSANNWASLQTGWLTPLNTTPLYTWGETTAQAGLQLPVPGTTGVVTDVLNGLAGRWTFDEDFNTTVLDWSMPVGTGPNIGTFSGSPAPVWVTSGQRVGYGAISLNAANSNSITVTNWPSLGIGGSLTVTGWLKLASSTANLQENIVNTKIGTNDTDGFSFLYEPSTQRLLAHMNGATYLSATLSTPLDTNWHHLAMVVNGATGQFYVDGAAVTMTNTSTGGVIGSANPLQIGPGVTGDLDDVRIYNRALSSSEITTIHGVTQ
jgi:hypothetical protein